MPFSPPQIPPPGMAPPLSATGVAPVLQLHPTRRCNLACAHCYTSSGPQAREELPIELLLACLGDAVDLGYRQLAVSGGEPLLYPDLENLLREARRLEMITTITSNGLLADARRWERLAPWVDVVAISVDGRPAEHDEMRRRNGAWERTIAHLPIIRESGVPFGFIFTLTQYNVDSLEFVVRLAAAHGARSVQVHPLSLHGRAAVTLSDARPDGVELAVALIEASRLGRELGVAVHVDALTVAQLIAYRRCLVPERPATRLVDLAPVLVVAADASVIPLTHEVNRALHLGSLNRAPLSVLSSKWLSSGSGEELAAACERTWHSLVHRDPAQAVYWYDEVAARTRAVTGREPPAAATWEFRERTGAIEAACAN